MRAEGNSNVQVCIDNLLKTTMGEVPYARKKGIDGDIIDMPLGEAEVEFADSADGCIDVFEPRVDLEDFDLDVVTDNGDIEYTFVVTPSDPDDDEFVDDEDDDDDDDDWEED